MTVRMTHQISREAGQLPCPGAALRTEDGRAVLIMQTEFSRFELTMMQVEGALDVLRGGQPQSVGASAAAWANDGELEVANLLMRLTGTQLSRPRLPLEYLDPPAIPEGERLLREAAYRRARRATEGAA